MTSQEVSLFAPSINPDSSLQRLPVLAGQKFRTRDLFASHAVRVGKSRDEVDAEVKEHLHQPRHAELLSAADPLIVQVSGCQPPAHPNSERTIGDPKLQRQIEANRLKEERKVALDQDMRLLMRDWNQSMSRFDEQLFSAHEREVAARRQFIRDSQHQQLDTAVSGVDMSSWTMVDNTAVTAPPPPMNSDAKPQKKRGNEPPPVKVAPPVPQSELANFVGSSPLAPRLQPAAETQVLNMLQTDDSNRPGSPAPAASTRTAALPPPLQMVPTARAAALLHAERMIQSLISDGIHIPRSTMDRISVPPAATAVPKSLASATASTLSAKPFTLPSIDMPIPFAAVPENPIFIEKLAASKAKKATKASKEKK